MPNVWQSDLDQAEKEIWGWFRAEVEKLRRIIPLEKPSLRQYEDRDSAPFYCSLCLTDEFKMSDNKTEDGRYFCKCSYWSDPHNAYVDRSGGEWLGWVDEKCEDNAYNSALDDVLQIRRRNNGRKKHTDL